MTADSSYMNIRFETLQQAQDDLAAAYAAIQATLDNLQSDLESPGSPSYLGEWTGSAKDAYVGAKLQWDNAVADMKAVLQKAHVHIMNAAEAYQAVETQNASIWHN